MQYVKHYINLLFSLFRMFESFMKTTFSQSYKKLDTKENSKNDEQKGINV